MIIFQIILLKKSFNNIKKSYKSYNSIIRQKNFKWLYNTKFKKYLHTMNKNIRIGNIYGFDVTIGDYIEKLKL